MMFLILEYSHPLLPRYSSTPELCNELLTHCELQIERKTIISISSPGWAGVRQNKEYYIDLHYVILVALKFLVLLDVKNIEPPHIGLGNIY